MSRPKGSKNRKPTQLAFEGIGVPEHNAPEYPGTTKLTQYEVTNTMEITHSLKVINQGNFPEIEQDLKNRFFDKGWKLFNTHFGGMQPEGMIIIYVFTRETSAS